MSSIYDPNFPNSNLRNVVLYFERKRFLNKNCISKIIEFLVGSKYVVMPNVKLVRDYDSISLTFRRGNNDEVTIRTKCDNLTVNAIKSVRSLGRRGLVTNRGDFSVENEKDTLILCSFTKESTDLKFVFSMVYQVKFIGFNVESREFVNQIIIPVSIKHKNFEWICEFCEVKPIVTAKIYENYDIDIEDENL